MVAERAGHLGEPLDVRRLVQRVARVAGEAAEEVGAEHGCDHRAEAAARLAGDAAVLGRGQAAVVRVDEGDDLVAEVRVVAAGAGGVDELAAAVGGPRVDEHDEARRSPAGREELIDGLRERSGGTGSGCATSATSPCSPAARRRWGSGGRARRRSPAARRPPAAARPGLRAGCRGAGGWSRRGGRCGRRGRRSTAAASVHPVEVPPRPASVLSCSFVSGEADEGSPDRGAGGAMTDQGDGGTRSPEQPQPPAYGTPPPYGTPPAYGGPPAYGSAPSAPEYGTAEFATMPPTAPYPGRSAYLEPSQSVLALVLGIIGLFVFWPVAPFAWVIGRNEVRAVDAGRRDPAGRGPAHGRHDHGDHRHGDPRARGPARGARRRAARRHGQLRDQLLTPVTRPTRGDGSGGRA